MGLILVATDGYARAGRRPADRRVLTPVRLRGLAPRRERLDAIIGQAACPVLVVREPERAREQSRHAHVATGR